MRSESRNHGCTRHARSALAVVAALCCLAQAADAQTAHVSAAGAEIDTTVLREGIVQFTTRRDAYVRELNSVAIVTERDVLVFDTNTRPSSARAILARIRRMTDKPVRYVVNSHWHPDHWSGNQVYADAFPGLEIIATEHTRDTMLEVAAAWPPRFKAQLARSEAAFAEEVASGKLADGTPLTPELQRDDEADLIDFRSFVDEQVNLRRVFPTLTYVDRLTLHHGGREFRFMSVTGDAEASTVLYLPREKVLITGDAVSYPIPYVTPPPTRHAESLRRLAALDAEIIVPGHGPAFRDRTFLELEIALLETVTAGVRDALRRGLLTLEAVQREVTAENLRERFTHNDADLDARFRERVKAIVRIAIREARDGQDYQ